MSATQRKAWNEAMRNAAGGQIPIPGLNPIPRNRSSRSKRREKARKSINASTASGSDAIVALRLDVLEEVDNADDEVDLEEEFDELDEVEGRGGKRRRGGGGRKRKADTGIPKRFKARSLSSILIEESGRSDGVVKQYLDAEALRKDKKIRYPRRKFCPVTGLIGLYRDPKSGIPYANLESLEHLKERIPPWMSGLSGGSAAYHDTIRSLKNED